MCSHKAYFIIPPWWVLLLESNVRTSHYRVIKADSQKVLNVPRILKSTLIMFLKIEVKKSYLNGLYLRKWYINSVYFKKISYFEREYLLCLHICMKYDKIVHDFHTVFLHIYILRNVLRYPWYPGYQVFATLFWLTLIILIIFW